MKEYNEVNSRRDELIELIDQLSDLFDHAPFGYIIHDKSGSLKRVNITAADMFGRSRESMEGIPLVMFIQKEDRNRLYEHFAKLKDINKQIETDFRIMRGGEELCFHIVTTPIGNGTDEGSYGSGLLDITEKRRNEEILRSNEQRFKYLAESSPVFIWLGGQNNSCHYFNQKYRDFTGRYLKDLFGQNWLKYIHPDDREKLIKLYNRSYEKSKEYTIEYRMLRHDGVYRWIKEKAAPFLIHSTENLGYIGIGIDVTEEKESRDTLEQSNEDKSLYMKEMHHRIKNNLQTISSIINLQSDDTDRDRQEVFGEIQNRIRAMANMHDYLINSGSMIIINIKDFINELVKRIKLSNNGNAEIDVVSGDILIDQKAAFDIGLIINEIITNSLKHAFAGKAGGQIVIAIKSYENKLSVTIKDNGKGISPDWEQNRTGSFGMLMIESLVKRYDGEMMIERDEGTKFVVIISLN